MIKFVIGLIALIFVALAVYTYTDKKVEVVTKSAVTHDVVKKEVAETKVEKPVEVVKEVTPDVHQKVVEKKLTITSSIEKSVMSENEIGKNLTLQGIKNTNVSDEEKAIMIDDLAHYQVENANISEENTLRGTIGKELSLEGIMSADISNEERERMLDDLAYFQTNTIDD